MIDPLRFSIEVACPVSHAFSVWTEKTSLWWPPTLPREEDDGGRLMFEPRAGGRVFERNPAGAETNWGWITTWDPPRRLAYQWHIMAPREDATEVEITFVPLGDDRTRVEIEHRGWERLGARGGDWRDRNHAGWDGVLPHFIEACTRRDLR